MTKAARWATLGTLLLAACASTVPATQRPSRTAVAASPVPGLSATALPGYVLHASTLDAPSLSADALDGSALEELLGGAGFQTGTERRFTARHRPLTEVVARVLRFTSADGAQTYVSWLGDHGADLMGSLTRVAEAPDLPDAVAFTHGISGCCTKDTFGYFVAWTRGSYAITLQVGGPAAGARSAAPLAHELDTRVSKEV